MNAAWWSGLSGYHKAVIEAACKEENNNMYSEIQARNGEYLRKLIDEQGVQVASYNEDIWDAFGEASAEVFEETRAKSALATEVDDAFQAALRDIGKSMALMQGQFTAQRNRVLGLDE